MGGFTHFSSGTDGTRKWIWNMKVGCKNYKGGRKDHKKERKPTIFLNMPELDDLNPYKIVSDYLNLIPSDMRKSKFPLFIHPGNK